MVGDETIPLSTGQLASRTGVSPDTLRHYERQGILPAAERSSNRYRVFPESAVERVALIRRALAVGFTIKELQRILGERDRGGAPCQGVRALAGEKRADVGVRLAGVARAPQQGGDARLTLPVLASDGFDGIQDQGTLAEGLFISTGYLVGTVAPANERFVAAYRRRYPEAGLPDQGAAASYDAVYLVASAISRAGNDRLKVRDAISEIGTRAPAFDGAVGRLAFDANGDVPDVPVRIGMVHAGELVPARAH